MRNKVFRKFITIIFYSKNNTKLDKAANGVPIVNISTPNKNGISINDFSEYNVGKEGQIINNADNIGRSHLGGIINANPNLAPNQAANLVILQVNRCYLK